MPSIVYPALAAGTADHGYHAGFPDVPEISVSAASLDELLRLAREALIQALKKREDAGEAWPPASPMERVRADLAGAGEVVFVVEVQSDDPPVRVNVSLGERLLKRIDDAAGARNMTRSGYLAASARRMLGEEVGPRGEGPAAGQVRDELAALGRRVQETLGPDSPIGRTLAEFDARAVDGLRRVAGDMLGRRPPREDGGPNGGPNGGAR